MPVNNSTPLWTPSPERIRSANLARFMSEAGKRFGLNVESYSELYDWSLESPGKFWDLVWDFAGVISSHKGSKVVVDYDSIRSARWFPEARLNFAENLLRHRGSREAVILRTENEKRRALSFDELYSQTARLAASLRDLSLSPGDRVAAVVPNIPESIIGMLAASSVGCVWSSCSPDFGFNGILDRFGQIKPKILIAADGYYYKGKEFRLNKVVSKIKETISSIEVVVIVPFLQSSTNAHSLDGGVLWDDFLSKETDPPLVFEQLPFDHPLYILYSSGTTGKPKCIVHRAGGVLLEHMKELMLHTDLKPDDRIFYHTTCGWMMWNWLVSSLAAGSTVMLYEGAPFYPEAKTLLDYAEDERITVFGTSARYLAAIEKEGLKPGRTHDLSALRAILSTGSPLAPESFDYVYKEIKSDLMLASITGGTDIVGLFAGGNPIGPVYRGELQVRCLGKKIEVFNSEGRSVRGEKGELVCSAPFPSMPVYFWNDPDGEKYHQAYFNVFPDVWCHGDYVELTEHDGMIVYGRSDAVLNPGGVRIGTAEIYRQVEKVPQVLESLAVGQDWEGDVRIVLFVKLREDAALTDELKCRIKSEIKNGASPRHVPARIIAVPDIPRTISGKIVELAVRNVIAGKEVKNKDALANPEALEHFKDIRELSV